jgi:hypothetical protein
MSYTGIYQGKVTNNVDPTGQHRIKCMVPQLFQQEELDWALPCFPPGWTAGLGNIHDTYTGGGTFTLIQAVPAPGSGVWIMFEGGDENHPVWLGGWQ